MALRFQKRHYEVLARAIHEMPREITKPGIRDAFGQAFNIWGVNDFQKRHKEAIWSVIDGLEGREFESKSELVAGLCALLADDNPHFSQVMFEEFCATGKYGKRTTGVRRARRAAQNAERERRMAALGMRPRLTARSKSVSQASLTSECWPVQIWGQEACGRCEFRGTSDCGGKNIIESGKNEKGIQVPLEDVSR